MKTIKSKANECLVSIAIERNIELQALLDENEELIKLRQLPNCLLEGDLVNVPESQITQVTLAENQHHVLTLTAEMYVFPIRIVDANLEPLVNTQVKLAHLEASKPLAEITDSNGIARFKLPLSCNRGIISFTHNDKPIIRPFFTGTALSSKCEAGAKLRLNNLFMHTHLELRNREFASSTLLESLADELDKPIAQLTKLIEGEM